ncbi:hypothetical protein [Rubripirellula reticaptiva]|uniref:Uncharacterized protein n=1 Tax=Rubripirellula reticaptiva TaxID=2528013 RepID=A0A5C6ERW9_9BACT|nr:hypothetical protein [Rubripirellula reticaptiva]TWU51375.1 hypothetical protein Poly59_29670 [Rubripirellula reticaptiva]
MSGCETSQSSATGNWDAFEMHRQLAALLVARGRFRFARTIARMRSPRRIVATSLTLIFFLVYLINGIFILATRLPADPERLRLWLSGGMVIYAVYHAVRCAWSHRTADLEMNDAETLWLGGAPIHRSTLAIYHVNGLVFSSALKTALLAVVLAVDVNHVGLLCLGVFVSLLLLEIVRLTIARWASSIDRPTRSCFRFAATTVAAALALQVIARVIAMTPPGSGTPVYLINGFSALGQTAASDTIQWLSSPWVAAAHLAVTAHYTFLTAAQIAASVAVLPLSIWILIRIDRVSSRRSHALEVERLESGCCNHNGIAELTDSSVANSLADIQLLRRFGVTDMVAVMARQWVSVKRYRSTILFSFIVPTLLCLSPLVTGRITDQWLFVVGGIALCTMLLAPPALRIDFRRDLKRMLLLRSLPVRPMSMVLGQLTIPVLITCLFQWTTIAVAAAVTAPGWPAVAMWTGMLAALSLFTFGVENALFLAFPHHENAQGVAMMVRAKLTFLGKAAVLLAALALLAAWATWCKSFLPPEIATTLMVTGAVAVTWALAAISVFLATWCWGRFDLSLDVPPA